MTNILHMFEIKSIDINKLKKVQREIRNELSIKTIVTMTGDIKNADYVLDLYLKQMNQRYDDYMVICKKSNHYQRKNKFVVRFYKFNKLYFVVDEIIKSEKIDEHLIDSFSKNLVENNMGVSREQIYIYKILNCFNYKKKNSEEIVNFKDIAKNGQIEDKKVLKFEKKVNK